MRFTGLKYLQLLACLGLFACGSAERYDVVIVGGGASGTAAGLQAARMGARTLIVEEFDWLGGMLTSAGVSATDGNYRLRGGIWDEFRTELARHYGCDSALITGWVSNVMFEPSVGDSIFKRLVAREPNLTVWYRSAAETAERGKVEAGVLVDATELGDVARMAGVPYDVGMDSSAVTHEDIAPAEANGIVQDLTYVAVLKDYGRDVTIPRPDGYDPSLFACCCVNDLCIAPKEPHRMWSREMMITYGKLPDGKYMINWPIEGNDYYVDMIDMTPEERADAVRRAKNHTLSFVYFLQHELGFNTLGRTGCRSFPITANRGAFTGSCGLRSTTLPTPTQERFIVRRSAWAIIRSISTIPAIRAGTTCPTSISIPSPRTVFRWAS